MPTYVYECSSCHTVFEADQRITEPPLDSCECGSKGTVKRLIQPVGISFKGSGFHINDYSSSSAPPAAAETTPSEKSEKSEKSEPTAEATPAPAPSTSTASESSGA